MSFENKKEHLEDFANFAADMGILYLVMKFLSAILMVPVHLARHPIGFVRVMFGYTIPQFIMSWALIFRKIRFYKHVGLQCDSCGCWVSKDQDCPVCGHSHTMAMIPVQEWDPSDMDTWYSQMDNYCKIVKILVKVTDTAPELFQTDREYRGAILKCLFRVQAAVDNAFIIINGQAKFKLRKDEYIDECIARSYDRETGIIEDARIAYQYFIKGEFPSVPDHAGGNGFHPQAATRRKFQKIRCTQCGGFSVPSNPHVPEQYRTCTTCGHTFDYSYNAERLIQG